jgi:CBS domain containing-hemolysin-like protein
MIVSYIFSNQIMLNIAYIFIAFGLVLLNAFFVAAEFGMVKLRQTRIEAIEEQYGLRGKILARVHKNLDAYLSACQLGITLASLGLGWIGEPAFSRLLEPLFHYLGISSQHTIEFLSFFIAFSIISFLHIVVGELMPKSIAIRQSERVSVWTALPLYTFYWLMYPAISLLNACSNYLLKIMHLNKSHKGEHFYSTDEIKLILGSSFLHGELTKDETDILEHTLDFADLQVTAVMRPIEEMVTLDITQTIQQSLATITENRYSRYPVIDNTLDNIIGIVHIKDFVGTLYEKQAITSINSLIRPILKVSSHVPATDLLRKFREGMPHFAIVYRGPETPIGFVTLDNILHILVGKIKDEFHKTKDDWVAISEHEFSFKGNSSLYTVERALDIDIFSEDDVTTLGGLILNQLGALPKVNQRIEFEEFTAEVEKMHGPRILKVRIYKK